MILARENLKKEENLECLDIFKTQPGPVAKNATLGHQRGIEPTTSRT